MGATWSRRAFLKASALAPSAFAGCTHTATFPTSLQCPTTSRGGGDVTFRNWAETIACTPANFCQPESVDEIVRVVKRARDVRKHVRMVGSGHSWAPLVLTKDTLMSLDRMQQVSPAATASRSCAS
jgi:hypothetical protein